MTPKSTIHLLRALFVIAAGSIGTTIGADRPEWI